MLGFDERIAAVRRFNRFYTQKIGVLENGLLKSPFSLAEVRVLYEVAHREQLTAAVLGRELGLDRGYLSRILRGFEKRGLLSKQRSLSDRRQTFVSLTAKGREAFAPLDARSQEGVAAMLRNLSASEQGRLVEAMCSIEDALDARPARNRAYLIRPHQSGDMGWIIHRHGVLYAREYKFDQQFEALVAEVAANFIRNYDPEREGCWMAELDREIVGSVLVVKKSNTTAKLRLLLVEPRARGLGIGARLVEECIAFSRQAGYRKVTLWTNSVLVSARRIYERAGFRLVKEEPHHSFGQDLIGETWELTL